MTASDREAIQGSVTEHVSGPAYTALRRELRETETLSSIGALIGWDQETYMPPAGTTLRAEQAALVGQLVHERRTSARFADLLTAAEAEVAPSGDGEAIVNLREIRRDFGNATKIPTSLVREFAEVTTMAQFEWRGARERSDFSAFAPWLEKVVDLNRQKADALKTADTPERYDALLDSFEPGMRTAEIVRVFSDLRGKLTPLIAAIADSGRLPDNRIQRIQIPIEKQARFNQSIAEAIGFSFAAGRLDVSTHPFCQGIGPGDTRLTTRYRDDAFFDALSSTLHEGGHGIYEQRLPKADRMGEPLSEAASLGIHESQSRLWENLVGRSKSFWNWALPEAQDAFAPSLDTVTVDEVYGALNRVEPNLIRVDSDEATYNLHIMLRFDLERALLDGDLRVHDLPAAWNDRIRADLGLEVPDDRMGCLQDVHWSIGALGYFPTYTLGNLYAAQLWEAIQRHIPALDGQLARGDFGELRDWLTREIHIHGRRYTAPELCERATGTPLTAEPFMAYLEGKLKPLYGL
jgi:carboxypeptidase Taq